MGNKIDLGQFLSSAKQSLFRLECLQEYEAPEDMRMLEIWRREKRIDQEIMKEWHNFIKAAIAKGVKMQRVRVVVYPLTEYTEMELAAHRESAQAGDDIRVITREKFDHLNILMEDFWMADDSQVVKMSYGLKGEYLGCELVEGMEKYIEAKEILLLNSIPIGESNE